jgi:hypothetical protein
MDRILPCEGSDTSSTLVSGTTMIDALKKLGGKRIHIKMRRTGVTTFLRKKRKWERAMKKLPPMYFATVAHW